MEENTSKPAMHLNRFDKILLAIVGAIALVILAFILYDKFATEKYVDMTYTIRLENAVLGTNEYLTAGDELEEAVQNIDLGTLVSFTSYASPRAIYDEETNTMIEIDLLDAEHIELVVTAPATVIDDQIYLEDDYRVRVGEWIYVRGPGYLGSGTVIAIERTDGLEAMIAESTLED